MDDFERFRAKLREGASATQAHILLKGVARLRCQTTRVEPVIIAFVPPGLISEISSLMPTRFDF
jgi:hypothetical protein